ncbi:MAG TPA: glycerol-3-phosphate 1-O-acyltransferase PlsY [Gemmatimonadales bacterium]|jgi:glycerol-3-phosphate acyltransferase PlsY|nr:glycerol-3-phosphate 1-O-acyltransferase PlsY [Gemmatimonadales bacterium]
MSALVGPLLASYLVGAIPTSYLVGRIFRGIDLREHGSKNLGATNLYRVMGWRFAIPVGLFDLAKGAVPVLVFGPWAGGGAVRPLLCGVTAVLGHVFSVFVRFKGGKGVATGAGVVLAVAPWAVAAVLAVWIVLVYLTGYVSVGSITAAALYPVATWAMYPAQRPLILLHLALAAAIVWFHRANIRRLLAGTENRFRRGAPATPPGPGGP